MMISTIASTGESKVTKGAQATTGRDDAKQQQRNREDDKEVSEIQPAKQVPGQVVASPNPMTPILRYVSKSRRRKGESPFGGVVNGEAEGKIIRNADEASLGALKGNVTLPMQKVYRPKVSRQPLPGFVSSSKALLKEENDLPHTRTKEGFDPNAYKLMERASYDFQNPATLGKVIEVKPHGLNETQKMIQEQGGSVGASKVGLGYTPLQPIKISGRRKVRPNATQYVSAEEIDESEEENAQPLVKPSVFDRLQPSASRKRQSVFTRIKSGQSPESSVP